MFVAVFDTNTLVSAMLSPLGNEARAISLWHRGSLAVAVSDDILAEYFAVLNRPKLRLPSDDVHRFLAPFLTHKPRTKPPYRLNISPHDSDNRFLECAEAANADFLITGNLRHFPPAHGNTRIVNARTFLERYAATNP
jgi:putative PIN family toxin of toxin-antitoxin system